MSKKLFVTMLAVSAMLAACSNDEDGRKDGTPVAASFTASINPHTKAYDNTWEKYDKIGVTAYMQDASVSDYQNVECSLASEAGTLVNWLPKEPYFYKGVDKVGFKAYYPYSSDLNGGTVIPVDATQQGKVGEQQKIDFLFAEGEGSQLKPEVNFTFTHRMAKLIFKIKQENENENEDIESMKAVLGGAKLKGSFDVSNGIVTASEDVAGELELTHSASGNDRIVTLIVVPQEQPSNAVLTITTDFNVYQTDITFPGAIEASRSYCYNITLKNKFMEITDSDITNWNPEEDQDAEAEVISPKKAQIAVGDYLYADGTIGKEVKDNCIGIVFSTKTSDKDQKMGWKKGYVLALKNVDDGNYSWTTGSYINAHVDGLNQIPNFRSAYDNLDGYSETYVIKQLNNSESEFEAFYKALNYRSGSGDLINTSGWYVPSIGQWCAILENLGGADLADKLDTQGRFLSITEGAWAI
ncbi:MAG: fimbrillin family protein [Parabacteroides sp.]|nr:fimbrillin family protein [Parabacteroides sp.]